MTDGIHAAADYEFSARENQRVMRLHQRLLIVSLGLFVLGALLAVGAFSRPRDELLWVQLLGGICFMVLGFVFWRPLDNLKRITTKTGTDISELMTAVSDLRLAFGTAAIVFGLMAVLTLFGIIRMVTM
jgi:disulfide bond formation protein DsbB